MICCSCFQPTGLSKSGLCASCRKEAHRPKRRHLLTALRSRAAKRWVQGENGALMGRYNLTPRQAIDRSLVYLMEMEKLFPRKTVYLFNLDNPYMEEHARRTIVSYVLNSPARRHMRKQAVRHDRSSRPARRQAA
jgi:hypothetical protein